MDNEDKVSFSAREERILAFWKEQNIFQKILKNREGCSTFSFYDGPPFATGLPHYGHLLAGTIKDVVCRYATMDGYYVPRRFGWDCHGVPVEYEVEKSLGLTEPRAIERFGVGNFNEECRKIVFRYVDEWKYFVDRIGRWVDFSTTWKTMDLSFMESVWWVFRSLYDQGLVYEGTKVVPFSTKLGTPLSNFEAGQNYKEVDDPSIVVKFTLQGDQGILLTWTTTPWTLVSNMALAVHPDLIYVRIKDKESGEEYILGQESLARWFPDRESYEWIGQLSGKSLIGRSYQPLFPYFQDKQELGAFRVLPADFIEESEGTGIVHMAPAFGEADFFVCQEHNVPLVCPVDDQGCFTAEVVDFTGEYIKLADKGIARQLKNKNQLFYQGTIRHRYPFCWRTDSPLIYKAVNSWFIAVEKVKNKMIRANEAIHWMPGHIQEGRFGKWLEGARDWAISRNRYWGTPIPIWRNEDGELLVIGSIQELETLSGKKVVDLHRHFIDDIEINKDNKVFRRVPYVFDCWFDSGAMPYAQNHYPFQNSEETEARFPADFIAEGLDQTRGWFYTLTVIAAALFNQPAFKNVVVNGIILAEDGNKMSKRLNNYPSPKLVMDTYGADALRLYLLNSVVVKAEDLRFSDKGVEGVLKQVLLPLSNALTFYKTYADLYDFEPKEVSDLELAEIDRWILSCLYSLVAKTRENLAQYDLHAAVHPFVDFIDDLTNWYIRRSRRRFWDAEDSADRRAAFSTLYEVLTVFSKIIAPFIPFTAEDMYQQLRGDADPESVHLCDFPHVVLENILPNLERKMSDIREIVALGHSLRKEHKLKVRQPLQSVCIVGVKDRIEALTQVKALIQEELNVKEVCFCSETPEYVTTLVKPNFRSLGKRVGNRLPEIQKALTHLSQEHIHTFIRDGVLTLSLGEETVCLDKEEITVSWEAASGFVARGSASFMTVLDCQLTPSLIKERIAREIVNKINTMRRNERLHVSDRIAVRLHAPQIVREAFSSYEKYICEETLTMTVSFIDDKEGEEWDINGHTISLALQIVQY